ncbi:MAG TPA: hypothetical protein VGN00_18950 [Puia sp.]|jgi:hypothetical protein
MQLYLNINGDSGVHSFEIGFDYILVRFSNTQRIYSYSYAKAGARHVEELKRLALNGSGLNSYINKYTKFLYD